MLTRLITSNILSHSQKGYQFLGSVLLNQKISQSKSIQLTEEHIQNSKTIPELLSNINLLKIAENPLFRPLMLKVTTLLQENTIPPSELEQQFSTLLYELRRFTSTEIHSNTSDLLNFQLFFKQMMELFPKSFSSRGFEVRTTMLAENLPKIMGMEGYEPLSMALLHYLSTKSSFSTDNLKKNIENYFYRYLISQKLAQSENGEENGFKIDPNSLLVLLSCCNSRKTKTYQESLVTSVAVANINKKFSLIREHLNISELTDLYIKKYRLRSMEPLSPEELIELHETLQKNENLNKLKASISENPLSNPIINTLEQLLQIFDTYTNLLKLDYRNLPNCERDLTATEHLSMYIYSIFLISKEMKINVYDTYTQNYAQKYTQKNDNLSIAGDSKVVGLWKISAEIAESLAFGSIPQSNKNKIMEIILQRVIETLRNENFVLENDIKGNEAAFIKIFSYLPVDLIKQKIEKDSSIRGLITEAIQKIIKNLELNSEQTFIILQELIRFGELKKTLIISKKDWKNISKEIKHKENSLNFYPFYLFLAKTKEADLIKEIPFGKIIESLSKERANLDKNKKYISIFDAENIKEADYQKDTYENLEKSRSWEEKLLKLHALILESGLESQLTTLLQKHSKSYEIKEEEITEIFEKWMRPFKFQMLSGLDPHHDSKSTDKNIEFEFKLESVLEKHKPIAFFEKYLTEIVLKGGIPQSSAFIEKILESKSFSEGFLEINETLSNLNFYPYFVTYLFSLSIVDTEKREKYLQKYAFEKVFPTNIRVNSLYKFEFYNSILYFKTKIQWEIFLKSISAFHSINQAKDVYNGFRNEDFIQSEANALWVRGEQVEKNVFDFDSQKNKGEIKALAEIGQEYQNIHKIVAKALISDLQQSSTHEKSLDKRLNYIGRYIFDVAYSKNVTFGLRIERFLDYQDIKIINQIFHKMKPQDNPIFSESVYMFSAFGLITEENAENFLRNMNFNSNTSYTKCRFLSILGKENSIKKGYVTEEQWEDLFTNLCRISSQMKTSKWIQISLLFTNESKLPSFKRLISKIYDPLERSILIKDYQKMHEKFFNKKIEESEIVSENFGDKEEDFELHDKVFDEVNYPIQEDGNEKQNIETTPKKKMGVFGKLKQKKNGANQN